MKAVRHHGYGGPEVLVYEDAPRPEPAENEVLIRVHAAGVNPADWKMRAGLRFRREQPFTFIPGFDVSGVVEAVGKAVTGFRPGDAVYAMLPIRVAGGYAEYVACPARGIAHKPSSIDHLQAAALPVVALTAWQALFDAGELSQGQTALIHAAAGGVGHIAVQLAKWKGAYVIGTCSERNAEFVRNLGADQVVDYKTTRFEDVVQNVDVVLDSVPRDLGGPLDAAAADTQERSWRVVKRGGVLVSICNTPSAETAAAHGVRGEYILADPNGAQLSEIARLVDGGHLKSVVGSVLPLRDAAKAHELSQSGHVRGKIVLQVRE